MDWAMPAPFGQLLRGARLAAGLTQEALAERAGVSVRAIQALERGRVTPQRDTTRRLAAALGLTDGALARFEAAVRPLPRRRPTPAASKRAAQSTTPTNLPLALTSFVGRTEEMAAISALLGETRLLTLVGTGGVGKTRLALEMATALRALYPQGVWLVELARLTGPTGSTLVPHAVAAALGLKDDPARGPLDRLVAALRPQHTLLLLDNCEHVLDACARLADALLRACPRVQILATSREPLRVAGEALWSVPPLTLPDVDRQDDPEILMRAAAVRLFVERATALQPHFALTGANAALVAALCRQLDGIPLALELAAARVRGLGVAHLAAHLDERFQLLTGGPRMALPQHQTLRAMVDGSYDLLTAPERRLFERLAVFAGRFTLDAVAAVCADPEEGEVAGPAVRDLLLRLVDTSLVVVEEGSPVCYRLLDTLRHYGHERLEERGEVQTMCARHAAYYLGLAEQAEPELFTAAQVDWADRLDAALDNFRAALGWCLDAAEGAPDGAESAAMAAAWGIRLAGALWWFWNIRMHRWEGIAWIERALRQPTPAAPSRAKAVLGMAHLVWNGGDRVRGEALFAAGVAVGRALDDPTPLVLLLAWYGFHLRGTHGQEHDEVHEASDYARGTALLHESLALARASGERAFVAQALMLLAYSADIDRDDERGRGRAAAEECLTLATQIGHLFGIAAAQRVLGRIAVHEGDLTRAGTAFAAELRTMRTLGDRAGIAMALSNLGAVAQTTGDLAGAAGLYEQSLDVYRSLDYDRDLMARVLRRLGDVALAQGDPALARDRYAESLRIAREARSPGQMAATLEALGRLAVEQALPLRGLRLLGAAGGLRRRAGPAGPAENQPASDHDPRWVGDALDIVGGLEAWSAGQAMAPEQAVAYALEQGDGAGEAEPPET